MGMKTDNRGFSSLLYGLGEMEDRLTAAGRTSEVYDILKKAALPILEDMQKRASVDPAMRSHALHDSLRAYRGTVKSRHTRKITIGVHRRDWNKDDYYPAYVEFGHGGPAPAPPHPFVRPAFDAQKETAFRIIREELGKAIDELKK